MSRRKLLLGNWKMFKGPTAADALGRALVGAFDGFRQDVELVAFPPAISIAAVSQAVRNSRIGVGAQNIHWLDEGAMTGEISAPFLVDAGLKHVLVAHSERRQHFAETDETANRRVKAALKHGLIPVLCVGETLAERDANDTERVLERQLRGALAGLSEADMSRLVIAYEPVWAIGTGRVATTDQAQAAHAFIRLTMRSLGGSLADTLPIVYGGSVKADNAAGLMQLPDVDGALVGGASLDAASFRAIGDGFGAAA